MLGHKLVEVALKKGFQVGVTIRKGLETLPKWYQGVLKDAEVFESVDVSDMDAIERALCQFQPELVVNCIGIIKQIKESEDHLKSLEINSVFPHRLADLSFKYKFRMIHLSTDCVFDGTTGGFSEGDVPNPPDLYGRSKLLGEVSHNANVLTLRTSIVGRELNSKNSLIEWFLSQENLKGFESVFFTGLPTAFLSEMILEKLSTIDLSGLFHIGSESISKGRFLREINEKYKLNKEITPTEEPILNRSLNSENLRNVIGINSLDWSDLYSYLEINDSRYPV